MQLSLGTKTYFTTIPLPGRYFYLILSQVAGIQTHVSGVAPTWLRRLRQESKLNWSAQPISTNNVKGGWG